MILQSVASVGGGAEHTFSATLPSNVGAGHSIVVVVQQYTGGGTFAMAVSDNNGVSNYTSVQGPNAEASADATYQVFIAQAINASVTPPTITLTLGTGIQA